MVHPELVKGFLSSSNTLNQQKARKIVYLFERMIGMGLLLSSGDLWKKKRRILNEVFHYDFIIGLIPNITSLCDEGLEKMELKSPISE